MMISGIPYLHTMSEAVPGVPGGRLFFVGSWGADFVPGIDQLANPYHYMISISHGLF